VRQTFVLCLLAFACDGAAPAASDAEPPDASPDVPFAPTPHAPPPPIPFGGGAVLADAKLVVVTFSGYAFADDAEAMAAWLPTSQWLAAVGAEYGVGTPSVLANVRLSQSAPSFTSTAAFTAWVAQEVGGDLPSPPSASTVYAIVFPSGASFSDPSIGTMCNTFTGYHDAAAARAYTFAAIGTCPKHVAGLTDTEQMERVLSHEVLEALTDPFGDGWAARDPDDAWSWLGGGELADVCSGYVREDGFLAVKSWSNASAAAGLDPCAPDDPQAIYFGTTSASPSALHVAPGGTATVDVTGFSTAPTSEWIVDVVTTPFDLAPTVTLLPVQMNDGAAATLTVQVPASAPSGSAALVQLRSAHANDTSYTLEPFVVRVP